MAEAMLRFRKLSDSGKTAPDFSTGMRLKPAEEAAVLDRSCLKIRFKLPRSFKLADLDPPKKTRDLNSRKADSDAADGTEKGKAENCGSENSKAVGVVKTQKLSSRAQVAAVPVMSSRNRLIVEAESNLKKPEIALNAGPKKTERLDESKYQEKFEATRRKYVEISKGIIESRKKIKMIDFKDLPEQSRLATTETKKNRR